VVLNNDCSEGQRLESWMLKCFIVGKREPRENTATISEDCQVSGPYPQYDVSKTQRFGNAMCFRHQVK
jgi:hypothetical protein